MSGKTRTVFESVSRRKLLQTAEEDAIMVSGIVTVDLNGTGDFSSINDAVAAAPNNTNGSNGYFMIFITAGVYEEYVSIPKNKKYLMMVGAGINQTVITGNRSVVDGWTTFNSATFGKHLKPKYIRDIASMISPSWNNYQLQFVILNAFILQLWLHQTSWR